MRFVQIRRICIISYSVKDHRQPRFRAADIMLFDRLVFPVPETVEVDAIRLGPDP